MYAPSSIDNVLAIGVLQLSKAISEGPAAEQHLLRVHFERGVATITGHHVTHDGASHTAIVPAQQGFHTGVVSDGSAPLCRSQCDGEVGARVVVLAFVEHLERRVPLVHTRHRVPTGT